MATECDVMTLSLFKPTIPLSGGDEEWSRNELLDISSPDFDYLDSDDCWLHSAHTTPFPTNVQYMNVSSWLDEAFSSLPQSSRRALVNKIEEECSPSKLQLVNTRTFSRTKQTFRKDIRKESIYRIQPLASSNGPNSLVSNDIMNAYSDEFLNETSSRDLRYTPDLKRTGNYEMNSSFTICKNPSNGNLSEHGDQSNDNYNNLNYFKEVARRQQESLNAKDLNASYTIEKPRHEPLVPVINCGTITKRPAKRQLKPPKSTYHDTMKLSYKKMNEDYSNHW
ncbi:hypothetical protein HDE_14076 [Halotydeus destructor]|nr:hypothetical protein HDE_14076 [Halotydeus destructor]